MLRSPCSSPTWRPRSPKRRQLSSPSRARNWTLTDHLETLFRAHMELAIRRNTAARTEATSKVTVYVAVGFVDLVGFTPLSQRLPVRELHSTVDAFEGSAYDIVTSNRGRVVKLIGDEVMFVALEPEDACEIALALVDRFAEADSNVTPRGGLAVGEILTRGGDYYGSVVNLASRIADLAVPNEILVTPDLRERAEKALAPLTFDAAGRRLAFLGSRLSHKLQALGCHVGQGYLFAKPMPKARLIGMMRARLVGAPPAPARRSGLARLIPGFSAKGWCRRG